MPLETGNSLSTRSIEYQYFPRPTLTAPADERETSVIGTERQPHVHPPYFKWKRSDFLTSLVIPKNDLWRLLAIGSCVFERRNPLAVRAKQIRKMVGPCCTASWRVATETPPNRPENEWNYLHWCTRSCGHQVNGVTSPTTSN
jgi:hypothetical protein